MARGKWFNTFDWDVEEVKALALYRGFRLWTVYEEGGRISLYAGLALPKTVVNQVLAKKTKVVETPLNLERCKGLSKWAR